MSKKLEFFEMSESPFKIYESYDWDYETPKSSHQILRKTFNTNENHEIKIKSWSQLFLSKYSFNKTIQSVKTPPTRKPEWTEPLAPIKSRRSINKSELKPKKLVFNDYDDYESNIVNLLSPMTLRVEKKFVVRSDDQSTIDDALQENGRKLKLKESKELRMKKQPLSDDKENRIENLRIKKNEASKMLITHSNPLKKNSDERGGFKHFRI